MSTSQISFGCHEVFQYRKVHRLQVNLLFVISNRKHPIFFNQTFPYKWGTCNFPPSLGYFSHSSQRLWTKIQKNFSQKFNRKLVPILVAFPLNCWLRLSLVSFQLESHLPSQFQNCKTYYFLQNFANLCLFHYKNKLTDTHILIDKAFVKVVFLYSKNEPNLF
jgi:hypothetical protein